MNFIAADTVDFPLSRMGLELRGEHILYSASQCWMPQRAAANRQKWDKPGANMFTHLYCGLQQRVLRLLSSRCPGQGVQALLLPLPSLLLFLLQLFLNLCSNLRCLFTGSPWLVPPRLPPPRLPLL